MREDIKSMTLEELTAALGQMGEPAFRGKQIFSWLHRGARDRKSTRLNSSHIH